MERQSFQTLVTQLQYEYSRLEEENKVLRDHLAERSNDHVLCLPSARSISTLNLPPALPSPDDMQKKEDATRGSSRRTSKTQTGSNCVADTHEIVSAKIFIASAEGLTKAPPSQEADAQTCVHASKEPAGMKLAVHTVHAHPDYQVSKDWHDDNSDNVSDIGSHRPIFIDAEDMKEKVRASLFLHKYDVAEFYQETGRAQKLAKSPAFEAVTLVIIGLNAIWIAVDTDHNHEELLINSHPVFQVVENMFCAYFFIELLIRFMAFEKKRNCFRDMWFCFDTALVFFMVMETWVMTIVMKVSANSTSGGVNMGNASVLRIARLLRLTRMARMARLLRAMPELMILVKGMVAASRSVFFTLLLLLGLVYVFAIAFVQLLDKTTAGKDFFSTVPEAMNTLWLYATLLEEITTLMRAVKEDSVGAMFMLDFFIVVAALMVMNMLIGVLVEVVSAVAEAERMEISMSLVKQKVERVFYDLGLDADGNGTVSKEEFETLILNREAARAIADLGVDVVGLVDMADYFFASDEPEDGNDEYTKELGLEEFMDLVSKMRGKNIATVKDIMDLRKYIMKEVSNKISREMNKACSNFYSRMSGIGMSPMSCNGNGRPPSPRSPRSPRTSSKRAKTDGMLSPRSSSKGAETDGVLKSDRSDTALSAAPTRTLSGEKTEQWSSVCVTAPSSDLPGMTPGELD